MFLNANQAAVFSQSSFPQQHRSSSGSSGVGARDIFANVDVYSSIVAFARYKLSAILDSVSSGEFESLCERDRERDRGRELEDVEVPASSIAA